MKKRKILIPLMSALVIAPTTLPLLAMTSCGNKNNDDQYDKLAKEIFDDATEEFQLLSKIYRPSFHTQNIGKYLIQRIKDITGLPSDFIHQDDYRAADQAHPGQRFEDTSCGNMWFDIQPNDESLKNKPIMALQAHIDMVCVAKTAEALKKMETNGVEYEINGDAMTSKGKQTSLGADDGAGVAIILALIKNPNFKHGKIRVIFTVDEEEGMVGAGYLGCKYNKQTKQYEPKSAWDNPVADVDYLLNVDNESIGNLVNSTAGALDSLYYHAFDGEDVKGNVDYYQITITGLKGGHTGGDIHKGRANAINLMRDVIDTISPSDQFQIQSFTSPDSTYTNAIPTTAILQFADKPGMLSDIRGICDLKHTAFKIYYPEETNLSITADEIPVDKRQTNLYSHENSERLIHLLANLNNGVIKWKDMDKRLVETSANIGPIELGYIYNKEGSYVLKDLSLHNYCRSCNNVHMTWFMEYNENISWIIGEPKNNYRKIANYWGWEGIPNNPMIALLKKGFEKFGIKPVVEDIHAGLEISWFTSRNPNLKTTSIGPTIDDVHTCDETLHLDTIEPLIKTILYTFENYDKY